ncbi:MAG: AsnC family protein [Actinomycetota bacterium]
MIAHVSVVASGPVRQIAQRLAESPEAVLVSAVGGTHDLIAEIRVATHDELHAVLTQLREHPNVAYIDTLVYTRVVKGFFISQYAGEVSIDHVDTQLIEILQQDGRTSYRDLAAAVGLTPTAVRSRVQRLLLRCQVREDSRPKFWLKVTALDVAYPSAPKASAIPFSTPRGLSHLQKARLLISRRIVGQPPGDDVCGGTVGVCNVLL